MIKIFWKIMVATKGHQITKTRELLRTWVQKNYSLYVATRHVRLQKDLGVQVILLSRRSSPGSGLKRKEKIRL